MSSLFVAFLSLVASSFVTRAALQAEILALRHQLTVLQKNAPPRFAPPALRPGATGCVKVEAMRDIYETMSRFSRRATRSTYQKRNKGLRRDESSSVHSLLRAGKTVVSRPV